MQPQKLGSEYRELFGKGSARKLRAEGRIPAVIYGSQEESIPIWIGERELRRILATKWETAIVDLSIKGKVEKECNAIIKDVQQHPATGRVLHVDFQYIHKGQKIRLDIPISVVGDPRGVKEMGGILEHGAREVAVRCMPSDIPDSIELDVSELGIHEAIHIRDVVERYPNVEFLDEPDVTLAIVLPPKVEVEPTLEEAEEAEEPEVIAKGKETSESEDKEKEES